MPQKTTPLLQGTLDLMILKTLAGGPLHGYAVARRIEAAADDALRIEEGTLYPALHRLARRGLVEGSWGASENNRRAKYYRLTTEGQAALRRETEGWSRIVALVGRVLGAAERPV
jgi:PadR family transcriptional regulator PadR